MITLPTTQTAQSTHPPWHPVIQPEWHKRAKLHDTYSQGDLVLSCLFVFGYLWAKIHNHDLRGGMQSEGPYTCLNKFCYYLCMIRPTYQEIAAVKKRAYCTHRSQEREHTLCHRGHPGKHQGQSQGRGSGGKVWAGTFTAVPTGSNR